MNLNVAFITDPLYLEHDAGPAHPERPDRLRAIDRAVRTSGLLDRLVPIAARDATDAEVLAVHTPAHLDALRARDASGRTKGEGVWIDSDTFQGPQSLAAALRAAGGVCAAVEAVLGGAVGRAFCAVRPPGHHATPDRAMGFCLLNNAAIAARRAQALGARRVFLVDWDVHHGNGTQDAFYADPDVFYFSVHQSPLYPGTGKAHERGEGRGEGATRNVPVPPGSGDAEFVAATTEAAAEIRRFRPEIVIVSAGYDAHERDPLAQCRVTGAGFRRMAEAVAAAADEVCGGRLVATLEGGYDLDGLAEGVRRTLEVLVA